MDDICRLCCSSSFVNNNIFDEENALYLKMSLYLPIKVFKNDRLPQKVCDKCSCKVNDFYQFCNETIEVQERLRTVLISRGVVSEDIVDLTRIKENVSPVPAPSELKLEQGTQTEWDAQLCPTVNSVQQCADTNESTKVQIKEEPQSLSPLKEENEDVMDFDDGFSDNSDDMSLITLKKKKRGSKKEVNGVKKKAPKKKKLKNWTITNGLPATSLPVTEEIKPDVKVEPEQKPELDVTVDVKAVKHEAEELEVFNCCICFMQQYSRAQLLQHYRQHAQEAGAPPAPPAPPPPPAPPAALAAGPLRCTRCRKSVCGGAAEWAAHWARHWERDRRPLRCQLCEKSFRDPHQALKHGLTHKFGSGEEDTQPVKKRFVCDLCPEGFVYMRYLLAHRLQAHPGARGALVLRCSVCARQFAHLNSLRRHLRAHSGERDHLCNVCGKALSSREHLKFHIRIHTGYKPNVCKTCGKGFVKKCNLTLHERVHSGEKPHVCAHCGKAFSQRSTLVIHERYHSGARPYVCALCGRGFVAKGLLSMHLKSTCIWCVAFLFLSQTLDRVEGTRSGACSCRALGDRRPASVRDGDGRLRGLPRPHRSLRARSR